MFRLFALILIGKIGVCSDSSVACAKSNLPDQNIEAEVRNVFAARCADCHGAHLAKPEGRFGYVLDLARIAGNPELVIPPNPEESELWLLVNSNEMPPPDSGKNRLTDDEKEVIRSWIAAGAPNSTRAEDIATVDQDESIHSGLREPSSVPVERGTDARFDWCHLAAVGSTLLLLFSVTYWNCCAGRRRSARGERP